MRRRGRKDERDTLCRMEALYSFRVRVRARVGIRKLSFDHRQHEAGRITIS